MTTAHPAVENGNDTLFTRDASLDFGGGSGVFDLPFDLPKGAILGMIGPSGCGKAITAPQNQP